MKDKIVSIIVQQLKEIGEDQDINELIHCSVDTPIYGRNGLIDSLTLVLLVSELEELIESEFGNIITLVDEKAMSQKRSPFRSVDSLSEYIYNLITSDE